MLFRSEGLFTKNGPILLSGRIGEHCMNVSGKFTTNFTKIVNDGPELKAEKEFKLNFSGKVTWPD